jgi:hypothetical protein
LFSLVHIFPSRLGTSIWWRPGALLISPFNVKWRCSTQAGGVEGSKFCLFSVALPARCVSSVSPRFHFRKHAFCFLPLAAILESPKVYFLTSRLTNNLIMSVKKVFVFFFKKSIYNPCEINPDHHFLGKSITSMMIREMKKERGSTKESGELFMS